MTEQPITRENWTQVAADVLGKHWKERLAIATDYLWPTVHAYAVGRRTPSDEWLAQVAAIVAARRVEQ